MRKPQKSSSITLNAPTSVLAQAAAWYGDTVDRLTRAWEPRFRYRQYRRTEDGDWDVRAAPMDELEEAIGALPLLQEDANAYVVLSVSPSMGHVSLGEPNYEAGQAIALDVLARARRLGFFAKSCPRALRFPDLPPSILDLQRDDLEKAEYEVREAWPPSEQAAAQERLDAMRAGKIPALTKEQKQARHEEKRRQIILAYKARLDAAGVDSGWVEVPPEPRTAKATERRAA